MHKVHLGSKNVAGRGERRKKGDRAKCVLKSEQAGSSLMGHTKAQPVRALDVASL